MAKYKVNVDRGFALPGKTVPVHGVFDTEGKAFSQLSEEQHAKLDREIEVAVSKGELIEGGGDSEEKALPGTGRPRREGKQMATSKNAGDLEQKNPPTSEME